MDKAGDIKDFTIKIRLKEYFLNSAPQSKLVKSKSSFNLPRGRNTELDELIKNVGKTNIRVCKPKGNLGRRDERIALMKLYLYIFRYKVAKINRKCLQRI